MPPKRPASGSPAIPPGAKQIKTENFAAADNFSNQVKEKLKTSTRTGQACDRCKVRKIRCDGLPGGCSPCLQNNQECRTTDRITGRATVRGHVEGLEQRNRDLENRVRELEERLRQNGLDFQSHNGYHHQSYEYNVAAPAPAPAPQHAWNTASTVNSYPPPPVAGPMQQQPQQETNIFRALPVFRAGCTGDNYLGVSSGNSHLSSIKGTALSILGMEIDIADFASPDMDEPDPSVFHPALYNKSYQAFLQTAFNINPRIEKVDLPSRAEGITYAQWYFRVINPYCPILHKPTFMRILERMYDDPNFRPSTAETVTVHMLFAIMFFQYAVRNHEDAAQQAHLTNQSNLHYHFSLGQFYNLACSHTVADLQAMALICAHLRNFPKPGASWVLTSITMSLAIESGLHRSVKRWSAEQAPNYLEVEMRKRTFWSILAFHITLSGKLGRPMPLRYEDFDVELPEAVDDELMSEAGLDTSRPGTCLFVIGIQAYKIEPLFIEMYSTIYGVRRRPETYIDTVNSLESRLRQWKEGLPAQLVKGESGDSEQEGRVFALYAQCWELELRLLIRHPSVSLTNDTNFNAESMRICVESARQLLVVVKQLQKFKSLDTTWYNSAIYVMAITTTLFAQWERRNDMIQADLAALREEMDMWLDIMGEVGALLGSGTRLREAVRVVTDGTLGLLSHSLQNKHGSFTTPNPPTQPSGSRSPNPNTPNNAGGFNNPPSFNQNFQENSSNDGRGSGNSFVSSDTHVTHQQTPYPAATQYSAYPEPPSSSHSISYPNQETTSFPGYHHGNTSDAVAAPLLEAFAAQASQVMPNNWPRPGSHNNNVHTGANAWQEWTNTMAGKLEPQDLGYSGDAVGALIALGGGNQNQNDGNTAPMADMTSTGQPTTMAEQNGMNNGGMPGVTWPLVVFDMGQNQNGQSS